MKGAPPGTLIAGSSCADVQAVDAPEVPVAPAPDVVVADPVDPVGPGADVVVVDDPEPAVGLEEPHPARARLAAIRIAAIGVTTRGRGLIGTVGLLSAPGIESGGGLV